MNCLENVEHYNDYVAIKNAMYEYQSLYLLVQMKTEIFKVSQKHQRDLNYTKVILNRFYVFVIFKIFLLQVGLTCLTKNTQKHPTFSSLKKHFPSLLIALIQISTLLHCNIYHYSAKHSALNPIKILLFLSSLIAHIYCNMQIGRAHV